MIYNYRNRNRRKAFLGIATAVLGAAGAIGSIIGGNKQRKAQQNQMIAQANAERRKQGIETASAYTQAYSNSDELSREFRERFLRFGGRRKFTTGGTDDKEEEKTNEENTNSGDTNSSDNNSRSTEGGSNDSGNTTDANAQNGTDGNNIESRSVSTAEVAGVINSLGTFATGLNAALASPVVKPIVNTIANKTVFKKVGANNATYNNAANADKNIFNNQTLVYRFGGRRHVRRY